MPCVRYAVHELPGELAHLLFALGIPHLILPALAHRHVGVHAAAVHAHDRLGQETGGQPHVGGHLAADQLVKLNLVGGGDHFRVAVVDFELRGRDFGVVLLILEAHGALHFGAAVDELAQRIAGQRVVVAAGVDVLELAGLVIVAFGVVAFEDEAFDFVGGVERQALGVVKALRVVLEHAADIGGVRGAVLIDDFAEDQHFAGRRRHRWGPSRRRSSPCAGGDRFPAAR